MKLVFKGDGSFRLPPDQMGYFTRNGKTVHYDVDSLITDYNGKQANLVNVNEIYKPDGKVDSEYAMKTDNNNPIIIVRFDDGIYEVLDGNHRLFRAVREGKSQILAHTLDEGELNKYFLGEELKIGEE